MLRTFKEATSLDINVLEFCEDILTSYGYHNYVIMFACSKGYKLDKIETIVATATLKDLKKHLQYIFFFSSCIVLL